MSNVHLNSLGLLAVLAPLTRTAGPALAYPTLYPARHPYYPIDLGLWVLGIGHPPNDNRTSFSLLFPTTNGGSNSVPFMFGLYAQGGLLVALIGALVLGAVWRTVWLIAEPYIATPVGACVGASLIIFAVYVAQDSIIDSLFTSYGIAWPLLITVAAGVLSLVIVKLRRSRTVPEAG